MFGSCDDPVIVAVMIYVSCHLVLVIGFVVKVERNRRRGLVDHGVVLAQRGRFFCSMA